MVNLRELQLTINHVISPKVQYGGLKMWELTWIMGGCGLFLLLGIESSESCELIHEVLWRVPNFGTRS